MNEMLKDRANGQDGGDAGRRRSSRAHRDEPPPRPRYLRIASYLSVEAPAHGCRYYSDGTRDLDNSDTESG
jgi:hypothetical protein